MVKNSVNSVEKNSLLCDRFDSPLGELYLTASEHGLCGIYYPQQKHFPKKSETWIEGKNAFLDDTKAWLSDYFAEKNHKAPKLDLSHGTAFQQSVWTALLDIRKGETCSYGDIAKAIGKPAANRAVGAAVGKNPVSLIVPCHRVIGSSGSMTGYAGGLDRKMWALKHEGFLKCLF